jgi:glycosyltransferase involved in cell wall biosynthesis
LPLGLNCKTVVSIHDLCYEHYPEFFRPSERLFLPRLIRAAARRANQILTLSEFSRQDIAQRYQVDARKIHVVQPGIESHFRPVQDLAILKAVQTRYALPESFILFFGRADPRKGVDVLIQAYQNLLTQNEIKPQLIIAGRSGSADKELRALVRVGGLEARVRFIGIVPDQDLPAVISAAELVVYPSIFEGFGLPALEAMACGTPVITTNASSLPEVVGDAGLMFEPGNVDELAGVIKRLLASESARRAAAAAGLARAQNFSWTRSARQVLDIYTAVAAAPALNL